MKKGCKDPQKEIAKILKSIRKDINGIAKADQKSSKKKFIVQYITLGIASIALIFNAIAVIITNCQLKEMSRKPELYLEVRDEEPVDSIYNKIDCKAMIFRCTLFNSGNDIARNIKILHSLDVDSAISILVTSQTRDDVTFLNREGNELGDTSTFPTATKNELEDTIAKFDTLYFPIDGNSTKIDTHYFERTNRNIVSINVSQHYKPISYGKDSPLKLHFIWLLRNVSPEIDTYYIPYTITSDKGAFQDTLKIKNPFYNENKQ